MKETLIYADGSAIGNPGPGGWGATVHMGETVVELGGYEAHTTNNRMELTGAIEALRKLKKGEHATVHTDSRYVINGITKWVFGWRRNGWVTSQKTEVINKDLWETLFEVVSERMVTWEHVRGHMGIAGNERVDMIANGYARRETVRLFEGTSDAYKEFLKEMPKARLTTPSKKKSSGEKAYSYVSLLEGKVQTHTTWTECEARVKGKSAKFKKVFSKEEESGLMSEWSS